MRSSSTSLRFVGRRLMVSARTASHSEEQQSRLVAIAVRLPFSSELESGTGVRCGGGACVLHGSRDAACIDLDILESSSEMEELAFL